MTKYALLFPILSTLALAACADQPKYPSGVAYTCENGASADVQALNTGRLALSYEGKVIPMTRQSSTDGLRFTGNGWEFWGKGDQSTLTPPGGPVVKCQEVSRRPGD